MYWQPTRPFVLVCRCLRLLYLPAKEVEVEEEGGGGGGPLLLYSLSPSRSSCICWCMAQLRDATKDVFDEERPRGLCSEMEGWPDEFQGNAIATIFGCCR